MLLPFAHWHNIPPGKTGKQYEHFSSIKEDREPGHWALKKLTWHTLLNFICLQEEDEMTKCCQALKPENWNYFFLEILSMEGKQIAQTKTETKPQTTVLIFCLFKNYIFFLGKVISFSVNFKLNLRYFLTNAAESRWGPLCYLFRENNKKRLCLRQGLAKSYQSLWSRCRVYLVSGPVIWKISNIHHVNVLNNINLKFSWVWESPKRF